MRSLTIWRPSERLSVLCLGAHSDDIEIGIGGTLLQWLNEGVQLDVVWCVLSAIGPRKSEARASAADFLSRAERCRLELHSFRDGYFPAQTAELKTYFEEMKTRIEPDIIFTHRHDDAHQDHRETCRHTWNTFRDHMIFEYEVPKWDGDIGRPNLYVPIHADVMARKIQLLNQHFVTQRGKHWFDEETFRGLARMRGVECRAKDRYAEGLFAHKLLLR